MFGRVKLDASSKQNNYPTNPFTILGPQDQESGEFYEVHERRATDFAAPEM